MPVGVYKRKKRPWNFGLGLNLTNYGYKRITAPDGRRMLEHRYIYEQFIGRDLLPSEVIHHKNHCRTDNRIENLELLPSHSQHMREHPTKFKTDWSKIFIPNRFDVRRSNKCIAPGCKRLWRDKDLGKCGARGLCRTHYISWRKWTRK